MKTRVMAEEATLVTEEESTQLMTVQEVARELRVHDTTVRRWIYAGTLRNVFGLPGQKNRITWRIPRSSLAAMVVSVNVSVLPA